MKQLILIILLNFFLANFSFAQKSRIPEYFLCSTQVQSKEEISVNLIREIANGECNVLKITDTLGNEVEIRSFLLVHSKYYKDDSNNKVRKNQYLVDTIKNNKLSLKMKSRLKKAKVGDYLVIAEVKCYIYGAERILNGLAIRIKE